MSDTDATQTRQDVVADVDEIIEHVINANMLSMPYHVYSELFDAVDGLGVEIENLQAENAKTFEVGKRWMAKAARFEAENSKLRELLASTISNYVDGYMDGTSARYPCDLCDESSMQQCDYQHDGQCPFYSQLRELGIEVDDGNET